MPPVRSNRIRCVFSAALAGSLSLFSNSPSATHALPHPSTTLTTPGRVPGFTEHIFPEAAKAGLNLVANVGLCLFLFLVGLEIDAGVIKRNARLSATVAFAGMALPFGLGAALSIPLYNRFIDQNVQFTHFMLFTGVAYSITAFPVLCRILTELKLLDTTVGIVVLSAGIGNDISAYFFLLFLFPAVLMQCNPQLDGHCLLSVLHSSTLVRASWPSGFCLRVSDGLYSFSSQ